MKIFKKSFINEITNEAGAAIEVERYLSVNHVLKKARIETPKLISYDNSSITLEYIELDHLYSKPNFEKFHLATDDYYRRFNIEKAEYRLQFIDKIETTKSIREKLKTIALENIEWVLKKDQTVFLHMDAIYKNYFKRNNETIWIDFQDAMMGPKSYDEVHFLIDCFNIRDFDITKFDQYQQKSAAYNTIRQYGIFCAIPRFKKHYEFVTKYNINKVLKGLSYDLEIT